MKAVGIDIGDRAIRLVRITKDNGKPTLLAASVHTLSHDILRPFSDSTPDSRELKYQLRDIVRSSVGRVSSAALSLPDRIFRILPLDLDELPASKADTVHILKWKMKKSLPYRVEDAQVDFQIIDRKERGARVLAAFALRDEIRHCEDIFRDIGIAPRHVCSASINTFNLVSTYGDTPESSAVLLTLENRFSLFLCKNRLIEFIRTKEMPTTPEKVLQEFHSSISYHLRSHPDFSLNGALYFGKDIGLEKRNELQKLVNISHIEYIHVKDIIQNPLHLNEQAMEQYAPAIGAALSL